MELGTMQKRCGCLLLAFIVVVIVLQTAAIIYLINRPQEDKELGELMSALRDNFPEHNCTDIACHWAALHKTQTSQLSARQVLLDKVYRESRSDKGLWNHELKENSSWALTGSMSSLQKNVVDQPALNREVKALTGSMSSLQTKMEDLSIIYRELKGSMSSLQEKVVDLPILNRELKALTDSMSSLQTKVGDLPTLNRELKALRDSMSSLQTKVGDLPILNRERKALTDNISSLQAKVVDLPILNREPKAPMPRDCTDVMAEGNFQDGVYTLYSLPEGFKAYCDMSFDGGGWTVIQRRQDGSVSFSHSWDAYKNGFGTVTGEHWLGLQKIYSLTVIGGYQLRIDFHPTSRIQYHALYEHFSVGLNLLDPEKDGYPLRVDGYSGNTGDSFSSHSGMKFSTVDRDQDILPNLNCASVQNSGWWYKDCGNADLNAPYWDGIRCGIKWSNWDNLPFVEMKIRPNKAPTCRCCRKSH